MKKILTATLLLLSSVVLSNLHAQTKYDIRIVDARNFKEPAMDWKNENDVATHNADLSRHKHREVNVYNYGAYYKVNYFQDENGTIMAHGFMISESGPRFDQAEYCWSSDTLCIHLFNGDTKSKIYKGYGKGSTNSMKID